MDKIVQISYKGRQLAFEETAYQNFQHYELALKNHFLKEEGGEEVFDDIQNRMAEILEQQSRNQAVTVADVEYIIELIGRPSDLGEVNELKTDPVNSKPAEKPKLYRDRKDKILAGVCSGIAHYFSIDPIAVRLIFVLFALFNLATFFALNLSVVTYLVLWGILSPKHLEPGLSRRLFRNPNDKVLGGVCSGLAQFFHTETWIVRLIMVSPLILSLVSGHRHHIPFHLVGDSLASLMIISYMLLWFIAPLAKTPTDYMLLKGEPVNLNTLQHNSAREEVMKSAGGALTGILKAVAYLFIILIAVSVSFSLLGLGITALFASDIAEIILFSGVNKTLALIGLLLIVILPLLATLLWIFRRITGTRANSKPYRLTFASLWILGLVCLAWVSINLVKRMHTYSRTQDRISLAVATDTLVVDQLEGGPDFNRQVFFDLNEMNSLVKHQNGRIQVKAIRLLHDESPDSQFHLLIQRAGFGAGQRDASEQISRSIIQYNMWGNTLQIAPYLELEARKPYNLQHVTYTILIPKGKSVRISSQLKQALRHDYAIGNKDWEWDWEDEDNTSEQEIIYVPQDGQPSAPVEDLRAERMREATDELKRTQEEADAAVRQKEEELKRAKAEAQQKIQDAANALKEVVQDSLKK
ncbi:MAG: PspC domain-containing protein [Chitinophagaceae bacterium]|nr:PspC domain-containing protein [Chitinophagaceae bacterium]